VANVLPLSPVVALATGAPSAREGDRTLSKHPSLIHAAIQRLDAKMAIGESRHALKQGRRALGEATGAPTLWSITDGRIHSHQTRADYQATALRFLNWARQREGLRTLDRVDTRADELASAYLRERLADGKSPYTLQAERAALRLFFDRRDLAASVTLPRRTREGITQNRGDALYGVAGFAPAHWTAETDFLVATGLRRSEALRVRVRDVFRGHEGKLHVQVYNGKGGKARQAPVLAGQDHERAVLARIEGRLGDARLIDHLPTRLRAHALRRAYAQALYQQVSGERALPPTTGVLRPGDYDANAVRVVSRALGHNRLDVVLRHYLR